MDPERFVCAGNQKNFITYYLIKTNDRPFIEGEWVPRDMSLFAPYNAEIVEIGRVLLTSIDVLNLSPANINVLQMLFIAIAQYGGYSLKAMTYMIYGYTKRDDFQELVTRFQR